jgi:branched-chain amino acid transport system permease protein
MNWVNAIIQGTLLGGLYALFGCGLSLLFGTMRVINLSHGDMAVVAAYLAIGVVAVTSLPPLFSWIVVVPLFALVGYVLQRTLLQASLARGLFTVLLVTFGLSVIIQNLLQETMSADSHKLLVGSLAYSAIQLTDQIYVADLSVGIFVIAVVVLSVLQWFLSHSSTGRLIRAVAVDPEAAQLSGANDRHIFGIAAAIAFATVALAGLAFGMYTSFAPTAGTSRLLFAFEAVVIGGLGSIWGTLLGGIVLGISQTIGAQIDAGLGILTGHLVFLAVLAIRPEGLIKSGWQSGAAALQRA